VTTFLFGTRLTNVTRAIRQRDPDEALAAMGNYIFDRSVLEGSPAYADDEAVAWEDGRLIRLGRVDMTRTALEGVGKGLRPSDEVVVEATGNAMAVVRVLSPFVARVIIANPLQVKAIAHAHVKTDKIDAGVLASLHAAGFLPEVWTPDPETERRAVGAYSERRAGRAP